VELNFAEIKRRQEKYMNSSLNKMLYQSMLQSRALGLGSTALFLDSPFVIEQSNATQNELLLPKNRYLNKFDSTDKRSIYRYQNGKIRNYQRQRNNKLLRDIALFITEQAMVNPRIVYNRFAKISERTLRYCLNLLEERKWIIKSLSTYEPNPLISYLFYNMDYFQLLHYSAYPIDLFKLLAAPLYLIDNPEEFEIKIEWQSIPEPWRYENHPPATLSADPKMRPIFHGILFINAKMPIGLNIQTFLPINYHCDYLTASKVVNNHICIPCYWELFGVLKPSYYSGYDAIAQRRGKVHFDRTISLMWFKNRWEYWIKKRPYLKATESWNGSQFIEFSTTYTIEELFTLRFKNGFQGDDLFTRMGLRKVTYQRRATTETEKNARKLGAMSSL
jgi:hypothetical protein